MPSTNDRKPSRSNSTSSVASSSSSRSTRSADDIYDRLVRSHFGPQQQAASFQLWSAGNLRVGGRDLAMTLADVVELAMSLHDDDRVSEPDPTQLIPSSSSSTSPTSAPSAMSGRPRTASTRSLQPRSRR